MESFIIKAESTYCQSHFLHVMEVVVIDSYGPSRWSKLLSTHDFICFFLARTFEWESTLGASFINYHRRSVDLRVRSRVLLGNKLCLCALRSGQKTVIHHLAIVVEEEESPETDIVASHQLAYLDVVDKEVPEDLHEKDFLYGFTDWHDWLFDLKNINYIFKILTPIHSSHPKDIYIFLKKWINT